MTCNCGLVYGLPCEQHGYAHSKSLEHRPGEPVTLRDRYVLACLDGLGFLGRDVQPKVLERYASNLYKLADALLEARRAPAGPAGPKGEQTGPSGVRSSGDS